MRSDQNRIQIRRCVTELFVKHDGLEGIGSTRRADKMRLLGQLVYECVRSYDVTLSESGYHDFVEHLYVALRRIRRGCLVEEQEVDFLGSREIGFAEGWRNGYEEALGIRIPSCERTYFAFRRLGKSGISVPDSGKECAENDRTNHGGESPYDRMLDMVNQEFIVDLRGNRELRRALFRDVYDPVCDPDALSDRAA